MNNIHIKSLNIETFRGIQNLKLDSFSGINIFTGDNNSGKTSVLELLDSLSAPIELQTWLPHIRRTENGRGNITYYEGLRDLFSKANIRNSFINYAVVDSNDKTHEISISAQKVLGTVSIRNANRLSNIKFSTDEKNIISNRLHLSFDYNHHENNNYKIYDFQDVLDSFFPKENTPCVCTPVVYVSPIAHGNNAVYLKEILDSSELYPEMLSVLQDFDESIISINQYSSQSLANDYCGILSKKFKNALPLNMYGDGMKKAILLMSAVVVAKNGILLIDEFETAIHTSIMTKIYSWILKTCKKLGVQLFLTTHSKEALQKVLALNSDPYLKDEITLYTLYKIDGKNLARRLSAERAIEADENFGQELR
ncbi:MAG: AAA family ATPase [Treponema sp.]|nr:AAA family ATPase [Treponema sp.]